MCAGGLGDEGSTRRPPQAHNYRVGAGFGVCKDDEPEAAVAAARERVGRQGALHDGAEGLEERPHHLGAFGEKA